MKLKKVLIVVAVAAVVVGALWWLRSPRAGATEAGPGASAASRRHASDMRTQERRARMRALRKSRAQGQEVQEEIRVKPVINLESDEYAELDELQREILQELQNAVDLGDFDAFRTALERMKALGMARANADGSSDWSRYVSFLLRQHAVAALGWFGASALPELIEFLADADMEIVEDTQRQLELALLNLDMGDVALAEVVVNLMSVVDDPDSVGFYYMMLSRMRNSVMVSTIVEIARSGTPAAQEKIPEIVKYYTGDETITTVEQLEEWLRDHPDGPDDEKTFGPVDQASKGPYHQAKVPGWVDPKTGK